jgi:hypothetical protein
MSIREIFDVLVFLPMINTNSIPFIVRVQMMVKIAGPVEKFPPTIYNNLQLPLIGAGASGVLFKKKDTCLRRCLSDI